MNLEAFRRGRLAEARAAAEQIRATAEAAAEARLVEAAHTAEAILARAGEEAAAEAEREHAAAMVRERRRARRVVLEAQRSAYDELVQRVRARASALRTDPAYQELLDGLEQAARRQLGERVAVTRDPAPDGGLLAEADGRRVDYSLPALADRCVHELGAEVERLWQ